MSVLRFVSVVALGLVAACAAPADESADDADASETDEALSTAQADQRADAATGRLVSRFWSSHHDYLSAAFPSDGKDAGYWIYAQAFDAVLDGVERTRGAKFKDQIARLYDAQARRGLQVGFFDDENWMALALLRAHHLTGEARYLAKAEDLMRDIMHQGWDGHGVWWDRVHSQRATASNFGPVITAARLYGQTGEVAYRTFAEKVASSRALLKFEGGGSTGPDRKIEVLNPKGTADEGHCQEDDAPPRGDAAARVRRDDRRASHAA